MHNFKLKAWLNHNVFFKTLLHLFLFFRVFCISFYARIELSVCHLLSFYHVVWQICSLLSQGIEFPVYWKDAPSIYNMFLTDDRGFQNLNQKIVLVYHQSEHNAPTFHTHAFINNIIKTKLSVSVYYSNKILKKMLTL